MENDKEGEKALKTSTSENKFDKGMKNPYILHASEYTEDFAQWEKM